MHWKTKAAVQNLFAILPGDLSWKAYFRMQRLAGGLRNPTPLDRLRSTVKIWNQITGNGGNPENAVFLEVGTGTSVTVPMTYWLLGAQRTITVDLNTYLSDEVVGMEVAWIAANQDAVRATLGDLLRTDRLERLTRLAGDSFSVAALLDTCQIDYRGSSDAADTRLPDQSIDFHTSYTVLEHVAPEDLGRILREGNRLVRRVGGLFVHLVDYSDHFAHDDATISAINFLQYSDAAWSRYADNRYMYMNRLRHDDMMAIFANAGHEIVAEVPNRDRACADLLKSDGFSVDGRFAGKSADTLSIRDAWIVSRVRHAS